MTSLLPKACTIFIFLFGFVSVKGQISDLRGGGANNVGTVRFFNLSSDLSGTYGNFSSSLFSKQNTMIDLSAILRYSDGDFGEYSAAYVTKKDFNAFGIALMQFGVEDYFERKVQVSYARKLFQTGALGINLNLLNVQTVELPNIYTPTVDISFYSDVNSTIAIGTTLRNILKVNSGKIQHPSILSLAMFYKTSKVVQVGLEATKIIDRPLDLKLLFQYQPLNIIHINLGLDLLNQNIGLGFAYTFGTYKLQLATGQSTRLPMSAGMSFSYLR
jgi:hypothetical protein